MEDRSKPPAQKRGYKEDTTQATQEIGAHPRGASELDEIQDVSATSDSHVDNGPGNHQLAGRR